MDEWERAAGMVRSRRLGEQLSRKWMNATMYGVSGRRLVKVRETRWDEMEPRGCRQSPDGSSWVKAAGLEACQKRIWQRSYRAVIMVTTGKLYEERETRECEERHKRQCLNEALVVSQLCLDSSTKWLSGMAGLKGRDRRGSPLAKVRAAQERDRNVWVGQMEGTLGAGDEGERTKKKERKEKKRGKEGIKKWDAWWETRVVGCNWLIRKRSLSESTP